MMHKVYYNVRSQKSCDHLLQQLEDRGLKSGGYDKPTIISNEWNRYGRETVIVITRNNIVTYADKKHIECWGNNCERYTPKTVLNLDGDNQ